MHNEGILHAQNSFILPSLLGLYLLVKMIDFEEFKRRN